MCEIFPEIFIRGFGNDNARIPNELDINILRAQSYYKGLTEVYHNDVCLRVCCCEELLLGVCVRIDFF